MIITHKSSLHILIKKQKKKRKNSAINLIIAKALIELIINLE